MVDASDNNPAIMLEAEKFTVSNYIVAEYRDSGLRLPKYPASIDEKLIGMEFSSCGTVLPTNRHTANTAIRITR